MQMYHNLHNAQRTGRYLSCSTLEWVFLHFQRKIGVPFTGTPIQVFTRNLHESFQCSFRISFSDTLYILVCSFSDQSSQTDYVVSLPVSFLYLYQLSYCCSSFFPQNLMEWTVMVISSLFSCTEGTSSPETKTCFPFFR